MVVTVAGESATAASAIAAVDTEKPELVVVPQ